MNTRTSAISSYRIPESPRAVVIVVDGAGGQPEAANAILTALGGTRSVYEVRCFDWTHGVGRGLADMTDVEHAQAQGHRLASHIAWYRGRSPELPVHVVAYSAGSHVALESARWLGPNSLERFVLLAPAVSADYDLRPALRASRQGIDVFTSRRDRFFLGLGTRMVGTADGKFGVPAAGRVGFDMPRLSDADHVLAGRLRQYPWDPEVSQSGNLGDHAGSLRASYLRAFVLPLLTTGPR